MATKTLYVGNLPYSISESDLQTHFAKYNSSNARIIEGRGFGFVDIDADQLTAAIADNNQKELNGRSLTVNEAQPKGSGGGGGGGGRSGGSGGGGEATAVVARAAPAAAAVAAVAGNPAVTIR